MVQHSSLTGSSLHESKGADTAAVNTIPTSNGAGGTTWQKVAIDSISTGLAAKIQDTITIHLKDISGTTNSDNIGYVVFDRAGTVKQVYSCIANPVITADNVLTCANNSGSSMGTITVAFTGSAAGDVDSLTPASNNTFTAGQKMSVTSNGAGGNVVPCTITILYEYA